MLILKLSFTTQTRLFRNTDVHPTPVAVWTMAANVTALRFKPEIQ